MDTTGQEFDKSENEEWRFLKTEEGFFLQQRIRGYWGDGKEIWRSVKWVDSEQAKPWREG